MNGSKRAEMHDFIVLRLVIVLGFNGGIANSSYICLIFKFREVFFRFWKSLEHKAFRVR